MTNGDSRENALIMLDDAKQLWLETALSLGKAIPEPEAILHD
jgi:predicted RNase H-like HicB family nuclease